MRGYEVDEMVARHAEERRRGMVKRYEAALWTGVWTDGKRHSVVLSEDYDAILALFASSLVKAQREAFVEGCVYGFETVTDGTAECKRRYPDA